VTGASGELGGALARYYARPQMRLSLWGRDATRLSAIAEACRAAGATVTVRSLDITNIEAMLAVLAEEDAADPFDLALLSSGAGDIRAAADRVEDARLVARLGAVNFTAPATMAAALAGYMAARGRGRIVLIGSAAGFHALPFAAAYSGTKAGLAQFSQALRLGAREHGVVVTLVSPGFLNSSATRNDPRPKALLMRSEVAAERIANAVAARKGHLIMPWPFVVLRWVDRLLPRPLRDRLMLALSPPEN
jgi:short-subunit dehydrogenase